MSGGPYLFDTNVLLLLVRGDAPGRSIEERFRPGASRFRHLVYVVTHGEIQVLARRNDWGPRKLATLEKTLDDLVTVDISHPAVIESYVKLDLQSLRHPTGARNMGKNDLWIAASAHAVGVPLLTTDKGFGHLIPDPVAGAIIDPHTPATGEVEVP